MSLKPCPECDGQVSDSARTCPHCGHPLRKSGFELLFTSAVWFVIGAVVTAVVWFSVAALFGS